MVGAEGLPIGAGGTAAIRGKEVADGGEYSSFYAGLGVE